jgi:hypothetical protein
VRAITQRTNQNYQTTLALFKKNTNVVSLIKSINAHTLFKSVAVNTEIYINECLQPRLLPFKHKHHSDFNFQFVHDLPLTFLLRQSH